MSPKVRHRNIFCLKPCCPGVMTRKQPLKLVKCFGWYSEHNENLIVFYFSCTVNAMPSRRVCLTCSSLEREVCGSNLEPVKSNIVLPTARDRWNISSKGAVYFRRNDAEMISVHSLHASAYITASIIKVLIWFFISWASVRFCSLK